MSWPQALAVVRSLFVCATLVGVSLLLVACAGSGGDELAESSADASENAEPEQKLPKADKSSNPPDAGLLPPLDSLPPAYSSIESVGDVAAYYAIVGEEMQLVVFDIALMTPLYQIPAHPLGRLGGVGQQVLVDIERDMVFVTGGASPDSETGYLGAHHASTGELIWVDEPTSSWTRRRPHAPGTTMTILD